MNRPVRIAQQPRDRRSVGEINDDWADARAGDSVGVGVVADERGHLVSVLLKFREYVRSDESRCAGKCDFHDHSFADLEMCSSSCLN